MANLLLSSDCVVSVLVKELGSVNTHQEVVRWYVGTYIGPGSWGQRMAPLLLRQHTFINFNTDREIGDFIENIHLLILFSSLGTKGL